MILALHSALGEARQRIRFQLKVKWSMELLDTITK